MWELSFLTLQNKQEQLFEFLDQSIFILVCIFIFFNPYPHVTAIKEICFYGSVLILSLLLILKKTDFNFRTPLSMPFVLFVLWSLFDLSFALNKQNSVHDIYSHLIKYLVLFYLLINFFNEKKKVMLLVWIIIVTTAIYSTGMMIDFYFIDGQDLSGKLGASTGQGEIPSNIIAISTLFGLLLSLHQLINEEFLYRKLVLIVCICASAIATLATQTRAAILAMIVSILLSFPRNRKTFLSFFLFVALIISITPVKDILTPNALMNKIQSYDRIRIWRCFGEIIKDYPVTGIGFGMQTYDDKDMINKYNERVPANYRQTLPRTAPHNLIVDIAVRLGIVGLALFLYIIFAFTRMSWRIIKSGKDEFIRHWGSCFFTAFIAIFIQAQFENIWWGPPIIILFTIWAMMTILWRIDAESYAQNKPPIQP